MGVFALWDSLDSTRIQTHLSTFASHRMKLPPNHASSHSNSLSHSSSQSYNNSQQDSELRRISPPIADDCKYWEIIDRYITSMEHLTLDTANTTTNNSKSSPSSKQPKFSNTENSLKGFHKYFTLPQRSPSKSVGLHPFSVAVDASMWLHVGDWADSKADVGDNPRLRTFLYKCLNLLKLGILPVRINSSFAFHKYNFQLTYKYTGDCV
jgi:hypothetical protein